MPNARPVEAWTADTVTARDVVARGDMTACILCMGCSSTVELNIWKVGMVLADTPLQGLRFRCRRCGIYPDRIRINRRVVGMVEDVLDVPLKPRAFDDGHLAAQAAAIARAGRSVSGA